MANKSKFSPMAAVIVAVGIIAIFAYFFGFTPQNQIAPGNGGGESKQKTQETPIGSFEFRDANYTETTDPSQASIVIVKGEGACDARPINLTARSNGTTVWEGTISDQELNCADKNNTSKSLQEIDEEWDELEARDRYGNLFALFMLLGAQ